MYAIYLRVTFSCPFNYTFNLNSAVVTVSKVRDSLARARVFKKAQHTIITLSPLASKPVARLAVMPDRARMEINTLVSFF